MKKFTMNLLALLCTATLMAQGYSTGMIVLSNTAGLNYSAQFDVTSSLVTITLIGPSDRYLGIGLGVDSMTSGGDALIYTESPTPALTDRTFQGIGAVPTLDATQNWTITSNTINSGVRTLVATRSRISAGNYTFNEAAEPLMLVWSRASAANYNLSYHGGANRGILTANFTLGNNDFATKSFKMYPNPAKGYALIQLPEEITSGEIKVYDHLGRVVKKQILTGMENNLDISSLNSGTYMVVVRTSHGNATKTLLIE
ncbi:MAG: T9SS type A sorting domain-containing protein [Bacteroidota bacterium]